MSAAGAFQMAFKVPGPGAWVFAGAQPPRSADIDAWLAETLRRQSWTGWYCYNDDPPRGGASRYYGHCKGIVLWNDAVAGWLVHSVPKWPVAMPIEKLPEADAPFGHSFAFWSGSRERLSKIESQIDLMGAKVYLGRRSAICATMAVATLQRVMLDAQTDHLAKNKLWARDMYESLGKCSVRSRASLEDTQVVQNVVHLRLPGWDPHADRSMWAVSESWVCVGDLRRGTSEFGHGGGGMVHYDSDLATSLRGLIVTNT
jgi:hypothetical protein